MSAILAGMSEEARLVTAVCRFRDGPGREREAAEAWAFELTYYFGRGVGEPPLVEYADGVYTCTGVMQTTYPYDPPAGGVCDFTAGELWDLEFSLREDRRKFLRALHSSPDHVRWDGRERCR